MSRTAGAAPPVVEAPLAGGGRAKSAPLRRIGVHVAKDSGQTPSTYLVAGEQQEQQQQTTKQHAGSSRWSTVVLLVSALANTLLLAFLFKAAQLDDRGLLAGRVGSLVGEPAQQAAATRLQGPARATTGQLSVHSIQQSSQHTPLSLSVGSMATNPPATSTLVDSSYNKQHPLLLRAPQLQLTLAGAPSQLLLSFNATRNQLELANLRNLKLVSPTSTSLSVLKGLQTSQLEPAPGKPLQLQAAQSSLVFRTVADTQTEPLRLVARGGQVTLSGSAGQVSVNGPLLSFSANKGVRLRAGLPYFQSPPTTPGASSDQSADEQPETHLVAHTLLAINGFLMASAA